MKGNRVNSSMLKTGVRQGCIISPILFLVVIDWVTGRATGDKTRGLIWERTTQLEDYDFADDIALLAHTQKDIQKKTNRIDQTAKCVGLNMHPDKTKIMKANTGNDSQKTYVCGTDLDEVQNFKYLGSYISADNNIEKEISTRIGLSSNTFKSLNNIW